MTDSSLDQYYGKCTCGRDLYGYQGYCWCEPGAHRSCLKCRIYYEKTKFGIVNYYSACSRCAEATMRDEDFAEAALDGLEDAHIFGVDWGGDFNWASDRY